MSPIYIMFSELGMLKPKLYKTSAVVKKWLAKCPEYKVRQFESEWQAKHVFEVFEIQHKKHTIGVKNDKLNKKISVLNNGAHQVQKQHILQSATIFQQDSNNDTKVTQKNEQPIFPQTLIHPREQQSGFIKPRTVEQLLEQSRFLYTLTPQMPTFLEGYTPSPILGPIPAGGVFTGYFDGCSKFNPGPASAGYYISHGDELVLQASRPLGIKTNNQAEFHALLFTLVDAYVNGMRKIKLFGDSKLVVDSINGKIKVSNQNIIEYYESVKKIIRLFAYWKIQFVERRYNTRADKLSNLGLKASKKKKQPKNIENKPAQSPNTPN